MPIDIQPGMHVNTKQTFKVVQIQIEREPVLGCNPPYSWMNNESTRREGPLWYPNAPPSQVFVEEVEPTGLSLTMSICGYSLH